MNCSRPPNHVGAGAVAVVWNVRGLPVRRPSRACVVIAAYAGLVREEQVCALGLGPRPEPGQLIAEPALDRRGVF